MTIEGRRFSPSSIKYSTYAAVFAAGLAVGGSMGFLISRFRETQPNPPSATAQIFEPQDGQFVNSHRITVRGTVDNIRRGETVWVFVTDQGEPTRHPQAGAADPIAGTNYWERIGVRLGDPSDKDKTYCLSTAIADEDGTKTLNKYMQEGRFPGYPTLPSGVWLQQQGICINR